MALSPALSFAVPSRAQEGAHGVLEGYTFRDRAERVTESRRPPSAHPHAPASEPSSHAHSSGRVRVRARLGDAASPPDQTPGRLSAPLLRVRPCAVDHRSRLRMPAALLLASVARSRADGREEHHHLRLPEGDELNARGSTRLCDAPFPQRVVDYHSYDQRASRAVSDGRLHMGGHAAVLVRTNVNYPSSASR